MSLADCTADELKPWRTVQAECTLAGFRAELIEGDDGQPMLVVSRWALCQCFTTVAAARDWIARVQRHQVHPVSAGQVGTPA